MENTIGMTGAGWALLATDRAAGASIVKMKNDADKQRIVGKSLILTVNGTDGDTLQFGEFVERNLRLQLIRHSHELRPASAANWIRTQLADSLRTRDAKQVSLLLAGYDIPTSSPTLHWLDYLGTMSSVKYGTQGYAGYFVMSTLDRMHRPDMTLEEGITLMRVCLNEIQNRIQGAGSEWMVRAVTKDGIQQVEC